MRKSIILFVFILLVAIMCTSSKSAQNFEYNVYTEKQITQLGQKLQSSKRDASLLFIVDFSNSMNEYIGSKTKLEMARNALAEILPQIPPNVKTGLRIYGHRAGFTYLDGCQASKLAVPIRSGNYQDIDTAMRNSKAIGWTPITYSLRQAINQDFAGITGKKHIILLTDGGENCDQSPCMFVIDLMKTRDDIVIDVIAFDVRDIEANNQLKCTAIMTRGKFVKADNESSLYNSLFETAGINKDVKGNIKIPQQNY